MRPATIALSHLPLQAEDLNLHNDSSDETNTVRKLNVRRSQHCVMNDAINHSGHEAIRTVSGCCQVLHQHSAEIGQNDVKAFPLAHLSRILHVASVNVDVQMLLSASFIVRTQL